MNLSWNKTLNPTLIKEDEEEKTDLYRYDDLLIQLIY